MAKPKHVAETNRAAEFAARESYGRILAYLAVRSNNLSDAEDALAEAFASALASWPSDGVPESAEAWLITTARRKLVDAGRRATVRERPDVVTALCELLTEDRESKAALVGDERLKLLLVCTHPSIDGTIRPALMLQTVLGIEAKVMAGVFLISPATLTKRLVRAKAKIRLSGISFAEPEASELPERVRFLLEAVYGAYLIGKEGGLTDGDSRDELRREALYLIELIAGLLPDDPEVLGLLALMKFVEARRAAQQNDDEFIPLLEQNPDRWDRDLMKCGYETLQRAAAKRTKGPFQLEAAIQAAHCSRAYTGVIPWSDITVLYRNLVEQFPTVGSEVGYIVATAYANGDGKAAIGALKSMDARQTKNYQPWWVAMAHFQSLAGDAAEARQCLKRALGLTSHPRLQAFLKGRLSQIQDDGE